MRLVVGVLAMEGRQATQEGLGASDWVFGRPAVWLGALAVLGVCVLLNTAKLWRPEALRTFDNNVQIGEAEAWWEGRLDVPERVWDTALRDGKVYSYFPPMFTIIAVGVVPFFGGVPHALFVGLAAVVPLCAYLVFYPLTRSPFWGAVLVVGLVCGTSAWPVLGETITYGKPYHVNHTLAMIGLLLMVMTCLGRKSVWLGVVGLALAALSRQPTILYAVPLGLCVLWAEPRQGRWKRFAVVAGAGAVLVGVYCGLNVLKFGHPLRTGYMLNHEGRNDVFAREAGEYGTLSAHWIRRNLYYTNIGLPKIHRITTAGEEGLYLAPNTMGTGIWWTTPLLVLVLVELRRLVRDRSAAVLLGAAVGVFAVLMFWHATGAYQRGYNRYSLDYLPVLLALIAPRCIVGWRRWVTVGAVAWSILYFRVLLPMPHLQVWTF